MASHEYDSEHDWNLERYERSRRHGAWVGLLLMIGSIAGLVYIFTR